MGKEYYPPFSWDTVPLYCHFGKNASQLTEDEVDFVATHFDFLCLEKMHGYRQHGNTETGTINDVQAIKGRNPKLKAVFYLNTLINYPFYRRSKVLDARPELLLRDNAGELIYKNGRFTYYDLANAATRQWWLDLAKEMVLQQGFDGLFLDAVPQVECSFAQPENPYSVGSLLGTERHEELKEGLYSLFRQLRQELGPAIILYNGMRTHDRFGFAGTSCLPISDGVTIEHFGIMASRSPASMASDIEAMARAGKQGKIVVFKAWPGFCWLDEEIMKRSHAEKVAIAQDELGFQLACFLAGAQEYSYFCYSWGYQAEHGVFDWFSEYDRWVGKPLGDAQRKGYAFQRQFAGVHVRVNVETKDYTLGWRKQK